MSLFSKIFGSKKTATPKASTKVGCNCAPYAQSIGCPAYDDKTCIWHPDNDPYGLKDREWVNGFFVKKSNQPQGATPEQC